MLAEGDPNIVYGGDPGEYGPLDGGCRSIGELIVKNLKEGGNETAFVRKNYLENR